MIKEVCYKLKDKREKLGYDLKHTVEKTKLHPSVIKDIESGNLSNINPAYLKGFMRIYAAFLGVELEGALEEIKTVSAPVKNEKRIVRKNINPAPNPTAQKIKKFFPKIAKMAVPVILGAIFIWGVFNVGRFIVGRISQLFRKTPQQAAQPKIEEPAAVAAAPVNYSQGVSVSLTAVNKCFVKVLVDSRLLFEGILNKGAVESWEAQKEIEFRISDGSAVSLEVNGKSLPPLSSIHKPIKSLKINSSGITVDK